MKHLHSGSPFIQTQSFLIGALLFFALNHFVFAGVDLDFSKSNMVEKLTLSSGTYGNHTWLYEPPSLLLVTPNAATRSYGVASVEQAGTAGFLVKTAFIFEQPGNADLAWGVTAMACRAGT